MVVEDEEVEREEEERGVGSWCWSAFPAIVKEIFPLTRAFLHPCVCGFPVQAKGVEWLVRTGWRQQQQQEEKAVLYVISAFQASLHDYKW